MIVPSNKDLKETMAAALQARAAISKEILKKNNPSLQLDVPEMEMHRNMHRYGLGQPTPKSQQAQMKCPCCDSGELSYSRSGLNGHIWAHCSSEGCVSFAE